MTQKAEGVAASIGQPPTHIVDLAIEVSGWSPCRSKRGVVIFRRGDVISHGHNFKPIGFECDGSEACKATCRIEAVHAEQNALIAAGGRPKTDGADLLHVKTVDGKLFASGGPSCVQCSKLVLACGIAGVWLYHDAGWKRYDSADFHRKSLEAALLPSVVAPSPICVACATGDHVQCLGHSCQCIHPAVVAPSQEPRIDDLRMLLENIGSFLRFCEWKDRASEETATDYLEQIRQLTSVAASPEPGK